MVAGGAALIAGADAVTAARLGLSMTALQASIGALNDLHDAAVDAGHKPGKPIPTGLVRPGTARAVVVLAALTGLALAAPSGMGLIVLALAGLAIGYAYDLWAKGTPWSWVPFALGIPLLPVFGWYGAAGSVPAWFAALIPMAAVAGSAVAVGNALADLEADHDAGTVTVATVLGAQRAWFALVALWSLTAAMTVGSLVVLDADGDPSAALAAVGLGLAIVAGGVTRARPTRRRVSGRAWEIQAVGAAIAAVGWLAAVA